MKSALPTIDAGARPRWVAPLVLGAIAMALAGCGSTSEDGTRSIARGKYKPYRTYVVGVPYKIRGIRYYPKENMNYNQVGIASWYGPGFHKKRTANGEQYNQADMTAAHPTLPMPTIVKVTNLENGRSIVVRVNDRGPFANDRIIDLSKEAARRIRMIRHGTARVRVQVLRKETVALKRSGRVYADMAALNRRYVDGRGSGTVISAEKPVRRSEKTQRRALLAARTAEPRTKTPARISDVRLDDRDSSVRRGNLVKKSTTRAASTAPIRIAPRSYEQPRGKSRAKSWSNDLPQSDQEKARRVTKNRKITRKTKPARVTQRRVEKPRPAAGRIYVQAAAYTEKSQARRVRSKLGRIAKSKITAVQIRRTVFYRVRLGPVNSAAEGDRLLARVVSMGYRNARVVIDPSRP